MDALANALIASAIVSLVSLIGVFTLWIKHKALDKILLILVAFSAGAMLGGGFLHLLPESIERFGTAPSVINLLVGFSLFFLIERILHWHHCHKRGSKCSVHTLSYMNLIGDGIHNFTDGLVIAASFIAGFPVGAATTLVIIAHEIPQELGDFAVLVYGGFSKTKALAYNFLTALTAMLGVVVGYGLASLLPFFNQFLIPFAAGGFIYIGASDLIPELHKEPNLSKSLQYFSVFVFGLLMMYAFKIAFEGGI